MRWGRALFFSLSVALVLILGGVDIYLVSGTNLAATNGTVALRNLLGAAQPQRSQRTDYPLFSTSTPCDHMVTAGATDRWTVAASDTAGPPALSARGLPAYASFKDNGDGTGTAVFVPPIDTIGVDLAVTINASAGTRASALQCIERVLPAPHHPPSAALNVSPLSGFAPLSVTADASKSTDTDAIPIVSYRFDFGDGTIIDPQPGATANHMYRTAGSYTVTVTAADRAGLSSAASVLVRVSPPPTPTPRPSPPSGPPAAAASIGPLSGTAPLAVTVDASDSRDYQGNPVVSYTFNFGDGTVVGPQPSPKASHTYTTPGKYTLTVTVTDAAGRFQWKSAVVVVTAPGPSPTPTP